MRAKATNAQGALLGLFKVEGRHDDVEILEAVFEACNDETLQREWLITRVTGVNQASMRDGDAVELIDGPTDAAPGWVRHYVALFSGWACVLDAEVV